MASSQQFGAAFTKTKPTDFVVEKLTSELNTAASDFDIGDFQLSGGQNIAPASDTSLQKRDGISLFGPLLGNLPVTGGFNYVNTTNGTQRQLVCYGTGVNIHTPSSSTPISGLSLTQGTLCDGVYFPFTDKFYITNQTDAVVRVNPDGTGDQSSSVVQGKYVTTFMNRLLSANTASHPDYVYYTDPQADTYTDVSTQWVQVSGYITAIVTYYTKVLIFTKRKIYRLENFTFDGTDSWVDQLYELPVDFGTIVEGTVKVVNGYVYFLGQDMNSVAAVYQCDGYSAANISESKLLKTVRGLSGATLNTAVAASDDMNYRLYVGESGQGTNNIGIIYDTVRQYFYTVERRWIAGIADFSCLWSSETNGVWSVYGGSQTNGQVYQLHSNAGLYDELFEERDINPGSASYPVEEIAGDRVAQQFRMENYDTTNTNVPVTQAAIYAKTNAGTPGSLVVRIETDLNGLPSGTLVATNATATISSSLGSSTYRWLMGVFTGTVSLVGNTPYWLVVQTPAGTQNSKWLISADSGGGYAAGNMATYQSTGASVTNNYVPSVTTASQTIELYSGSDSGNSFSSMRSATTGTIVINDGVGPGIFCGSSTNGFKYVLRDVLMFDTSSIPVGASISSAKVQLWANNGVDQLSQSVNLTSVTTGSNTTLSTSDYNVANYGSTRLTTDVSISDITINAYNSFPLNSSGISNIAIGGVSKFAVRLSGDIDNSAPTWISEYNSTIRFSKTNSSHLPLLTVTYTHAGSSSWVAIPASDLNFAVYAQSPIDAYADTKAYLPVEGKEFKLTKFQSIFSQVGPYYAELGVEVDTNPGSFVTFLVALSSSIHGGHWNDQVSKWNDGVTVWNGAASRSYSWTDVGGIVSRSLKVRVRNRNANQQIEFNRVNFQILPRLRNV